MRLKLSMTVGALALAGLAACGPNEASVRNTFRTAAIAGCQQGDPSARAQMAQAGISVDQLCTCAVDRYMQSATLEQLKQNPNTPEATSRLQTATMQCATELMRQAGGAAPGGAPESNAAPAAPEAPAAPAEPGAGEENSAAE